MSRRRRTGILRMSMEARMWFLVVMIIALIGLGQMWSAWNTQALIEALVHTTGQSDIVWKVIADARKIPIITMGGAVVFAVIIAYLMANYFVRPLKSLSRSVQEFSNGNFSHRVMLSTGDEVEALGNLFNEMAANIQRKTAELEEMAIRDQLTGLYNRRHLIDALQLEIARCERSGGGNFGVAIMDVDHFKKFNDTHGHIAGDEALKTVARLLTDSCRRVDTVARFGGEEFVVVLPQADLMQSRDACLRLRQLLEETSFEGEASQPLGKVTMSFGVASFPEDGDSVDRLLVVADERLYACKSAGRNCVSIGLTPEDTSREPPQGMLAEVEEPGEEPQATD